MPEQWLRDEHHILSYVHTVTESGKTGTDSERKALLLSFPQLFQQHHMQLKQKAIRGPLGTLPDLFTVTLGEKNMSAYSYNDHSPSGSSHDSVFHCNNF